MFILTAKLDKRKVIGGALVLVALIAAAILLLGGGGGGAAESAANLSAVVKTNAQRVQYLESLGWSVSAEPIDEQTITIPRDFSKVYSDYNALQLGQGFDLKKYAGMEAVRYTYEVSNHPATTDRVVADIIVYRGQVIAADIQSVSGSGFMEGIEFPRA